MVISANYNNLGLVVISRNVEVIKGACAKLKKMVHSVHYRFSGWCFPFTVDGDSTVVLSKAIKAASISVPICFVYQNVDALSHTDPKEIKENNLK